MAAFRGFMEAEENLQSPSAPPLGEQRKKEERIPNFLGEWSPHGHLAAIGRAA